MGEREGEEREEEAHPSCIEGEAWSGIDMLRGSKGVRLCSVSLSETGECNQRNVGKAD